MGHTHGILFSYFWPKGKQSLTDTFTYTHGDI
jgi:hypothetical protein